MKISEMYEKETFPFFCATHLSHVSSLSIKGNSSEPDVKQVESR